MNHLKQPKSIEEISANLLEFLSDKGYSQASISLYEKMIERIQGYLKENGYKKFSSVECQAFIVSVIGTGYYEALSNDKKYLIRCANMMLEHQLTGRIPYRYTKPQKSLTGEIGEEINKYLNLRLSKGYSQNTVDDNRIYLARFHNYLDSNGITVFKDLAQKDILNFITNLSFYSKATLHCSLCALRGFLKYINECNITEVDLSYLVPKDNYKKEAKLPSVYSKDEITAMLNAVDRGSPKGKRDYAMLLLATKLGLRASDICGLKFDSFLWERDLITLTQEKTHKRIELPLLSDVGNAVIDYLKYSRPKSDESYVFLSLGCIPERLQEPTLHSIVSKYMRLAKIPNIEHRKHGPHALRHSLAGQLLEMHTPLPVISEVLGHSNTETTKAYIRINMSALRQCALEVPLVREGFYERGDYSCQS